MSDSDAYGMTPEERGEQDSTLAQHTDTWITRTGERIPYSQMADSHLLNSYRMMRRNGYIEVGTLALYLCGPRPRGDAASLAFDQEFSQVCELRPHPAMDGLREEIERRGLEV